MAKIKKNQKDSNKTKKSPFNEYWKKSHLLTLALGMILLMVGYFFLAQNPWDSFYSLTLAPIILLFAYLIIFPLAILIKKSKNISE